jgi:ligand-binding SRPBCC domain-containing protein
MRNKLFISFAVILTRCITIRWCHSHQFFIDDTRTVKTAEFAFKITDNQEELITLTITIDHGFFSKEICKLLWTMLYHRRQLTGA